MEWCRAVELAGVIFRMQAVARQLAAKPGHSLRREVMAQELHGVGVLQIDFRIGIKACQPSGPNPCVPAG